MTGTMKVTYLQEGTSVTTNLALDSSGNVTVGNNLTVSGTGNTSFGGNVGIGTASPNTKLDVAGAFSTGTSAITITNSSSASANNIAKIDFRLANTFSGNGPCAAIWGVNPNAASNNGGALIFGTATNGTNTTPTEAMRIDSSGNVGIGTTSPTNKLTVASASSYVNIDLTPASGFNGGLNIKPGGTTLAAIGTLGNYTGGSVTDATIYAANNLAFLTGGATERMRIDSSGNLLVGLTGGSGRFRVLSATSDSSTFIAVFYNSSSSAAGYIRSDGLWNTGALSASPYNNTTASGANVVVDSNGTLYRSTSSLRYKQNVQNYGKGLSDLAKLRPVTFNSKPKEGDENPDTATYAGFIAEEVHEAGLTEFVQYNNEGQPDALAYANMVALLTKALQEAVAKITALEDRITKLESGI